MYWNCVNICAGHLEICYVGHPVLVHLVHSEIIGHW